MGKEKKKERKKFSSSFRQAPLCCAAHNRQNGQEIKNSHALFFYNRPHTQTPKKKNKNERWRVSIITKIQSKRKRKE
jgi:hypothetical protein